MQDLDFAIRVSVIGVSSVFLVMVVLMLVLQVFGVFVRRWERKKKDSEGDRS
jgi:Na+-transporting methylmalonyl-CoA/oxaloacetate decarboxylase gamma subunit